MLISFEGIDGAGKTTQAAMLVAHLRARGVAVTTSREPTDGPHGMAIRKAAARGVRMPPAEELKLFLLDRQQHVERVIQPALDRGDVVVLDRYVHSTAAYQGGADPALTLTLLRRQRAWAPWPDLTIWLRISPEEAVRRIEARGAGVTAFERLDDLRRVDLGYTAACCLDPSVVVPMAAEGSAPEVAGWVLTQVVDRRANEPTQG